MKKDSKEDLRPVTGADYERTSEAMSEYLKGIDDKAILEQIERIERGRANDAVS